MWAYAIKLFFFLVKVTKILNLNKEGHFQVSGEDTLKGGSLVWCGEPDFEPFKLVLHQGAVEVVVKSLAVKVSKILPKPCFLKVMAYFVHSKEFSGLSLTVLPALF